MLRGSPPASPPRAAVGVAPAPRGLACGREKRRRREGQTPRSRRRRQELHRRRRLELRHGRRRTAQPRTGGICPARPGTGRRRDATRPSGSQAVPEAAPPATGIRASPLSRRGRGARGGGARFASPESIRARAVDSARRRSSFAGSARDSPDARELRRLQRELRPGRELRRPRARGTAMASSCAQAAAPPSPSLCNVRLRRARGSRHRSIRVGPAARSRASAALSPVRLLAPWHPPFSAWPSAPPPDPPPRAAPVGGDGPCSALVPLEFRIADCNLLVAR
ncbi:unnamed protein product [Urochloa humidicola]